MGWIALPPPNHCCADPPWDGQHFECEKRRRRRIRAEVNFGPGYRVYFGKDGHEIVILLGGGTKKRQLRDIEAAQDRWRDYKDRKKGKV